MRNRNLDVLKFVASIFVIFIHISFPGNFGVFVGALARFAVPAFFMVSGYFSYKAIQDNDYKKILQRIWSTFKLFVFAFLLYSIGFAMIKESIGVKLELANIETYVKLLVFNMPIHGFYVHLWYLLALIYVYVIVLFAMKFNKVKMIRFAPLLWLVSIVGFDVVIGYFGLSVTPLIFRNFIVMGLPGFVAGYLIKEKEEKIIFLGKTKSMIITACGLLVSLIEVEVFNSWSELYLGSILIAFGAFSLCLNVKANFKNTKMLNILLASSLYVYIIHRLIDNFLVYWQVPLYDNAWARPIINLGVTVLISFCAVVLKNCFQKRQKGFVR